MTRYQERSPSRRAWLVLLAVCTAAWLALAFSRGRAFAMATSIVGMLGVIAALTMWSTGRYGNIRLTDEELRVGRARLRLADLHPWGVSEAGERVQGRLVGGAYASTMGTHVIGLTKRTGDTVLVQTKDPEALRAALESAMAPFRADG